jgi:hypothetical protein
LQIMQARSILSDFRTKHKEKTAHPRQGFSPPRFFAGKKQACLQNAKSPSHIFCWSNIGFFQQVSIFFRAQALPFSRQCPYLVLKRWHRY